MKIFVCFAVVLIFLGCDKSNDQDNMLYESKSCGVDAPAKNQELLAEQAFTISGWAFDEFSENTPENIRVQLISSNGQLNVAIFGKRGIQRPDIAQIFKKPGVIMSGFIMQVSSNLLLPGKYKIVVEQNSKYYNLTCNPNTEFIIKNGQ